MKRRFVLIILLLAFLTAVLTPAWTQEAQNTPTPSPTPSRNTLVVADAFVRGGPGETYIPVGAITPESLLFPVSINATGDWVLLRYGRGFGWLRRDLAYWIDNIDALPVISNANLTPSPIPGRITSTPFFPTSTPTGSHVNTLARSAYVRAGPGRTYLRLGQLFPGDTLKPFGRDATTDWIMIRYGDGFGWISTSLGVWVENLEELPVLDPDNLTPTPTLTYTRTPRPTHTPTITLTPTDTHTPTDTATNTLTPTPTNTDTPTATHTNTPTATYTETPTPTNTDLPTATNTDVPTATNTDIPTSTNTAIPTATNTDIPTATNTALPTSTAVPATATNTDIPTTTNTDVPTATSTDQPTSTPVPPTVTNTDVPTSTHTDVPTSTPVPPTATNTDLPTATGTEARASVQGNQPTTTPSAVAPTLTATIEPTDGVTLSAFDVTQTAVTSRLTEIAVTAMSKTSVAANAITETPTTAPAETEEATETPTEEPTDEAVIVAPTIAPTAAIREVTPPSSGGGVPVEAIIGGIGLLAVLGYIGLYLRGLTASERYARGFPIDRCPVCRRGELIVETKQERSMGIPAARHTVRCTECRSVLREIGNRRWRYAVDRLENPVMYDRFNNREVDEETLRVLGEQPIIPLTPKPITPPDFVDGEEQ